MDTSVFEGVPEEFDSGAPQRKYASSDTSAPRPKSHLNPSATPEDITLRALQASTALESSYHFFHTLALQTYLVAWVRYMTHRQPDGALGDDGRQCVQRYLQQIVRVFLSEELQLEVVTSTHNNSWVVYPFGQTHPYISFPLRIFDEEPSYAAFLSHLNRMLLTNQVEVTSNVYSAQGGAFCRAKDLHTSGRVIFSQFAYDNLLSFHFPRFQFVACFVTTLASDARVLDDAAGIDVDRAVRAELEADYNKKMPPIEDLVKSMRSQSNGVRVLLFTALKNLLGSFSHTLEQALHSSKVVTADKTIVGTHHTPAIFSRSERRFARRIAFFMPYLQMLTASVRTFSIKELNACWFVSHMRIVDAIQKLYPVNFN